MVSGLGAGSAGRCVRRQIDDCGREFLRRGCSRRDDLGKLGGLRWAFEATGTTVMQRRKQAVPAGRWCCGEAVTVVMASRS
jgi:hypothetical protein